MQPGNEIRVPVQQRSREKFETTLQVAETLILEGGLDQVSIPEIAKVTGLPRATIYQYFPDMYVLYAYLAERHMQRMAEVLEHAHPASACQDWRQYVAALLHTSAHYYNAHPVAKTLLLNGPFGTTDLTAHKLKHQALSDLMLKAILASGKQCTFPDSPNVLIIAVEIGFAMIRYSYWYEDTITDAVLAHAEQVIVRYIEPYIKA